jgi:cell wall-associated protease
MTHVTPAVTALSLTASVPSPQLAGTSVMWSAAASGGTQPYQYQWSLYQGGNWTASSWTNAATWSWTPTVAGDYQVRVAVRSAGSTSATGELTRSMPYTVSAPAVAAVTLKSNVAPPQPVGTTIVWSAAGSGSVTPLQYQWWLFNGTTWTAMTAWTTSTTWSWTPKTPGDGYIVQVRARRATQSTDGAAEATAAARFAVKPRTTCEPGKCH